MLIAFATGQPGTELEEWQAVVAQKRDRVSGHGHRPIFSRDRNKSHRESATPNGAHSASMQAGPSQSPRTRTPLRQPLVIKPRAATI